MKLVFIVASINWFLSVFDLLGAVTVTVVAAFIGKVLALVRIKRLMGISMSQLLPWRSLVGILAVAVTAILPTLLVKSELEIPPLPLLLTTGFTYTASYLALVYGAGLLSKSERLAVTEWLHGYVVGKSEAEGLKNRV